MNTSNFPASGILAAVLLAVTLMYEIFLPAGSVNLIFNSLPIAAVAVDPALAAFEIAFATSATAAPVNVAVAISLAVNGIL